MKKYVAMLALAVVHAGVMIGQTTTPTTTEPTIKLTLNLPVFQGLPPGMTATHDTATGNLKITGTAKKSGAYKIRVGLTDAKGASTEKDVWLFVTPKLEPIMFTGALGEDANFTVNVRTEIE